MVINVAFKKTRMEQLKHWSLKKAASLYGPDSALAQVRESLLEAPDDEEFEMDLHWLKTKSLAEHFYTLALTHYRLVYAGYLVSLSLVGALLLNLCCGLQWVPAIFMAFSSVMGGGLAIVETSEMNSLTLGILAGLMTLGSQLLMTLIPVLLRRVAFRSWHTWCIEQGKPKPSADEDGTLELLVRLVSSYCLVCLTLGFFSLWVVDALVVQDGSLDCFTALFMAISAFSSNGLTLTSTYMSSLSPYNSGLFILAALVVLGNTGAPICLRCITAIACRVTKPGRRKNQLQTLLENPRQFYTWMFPAAQTLWLLLVLALLVVAQILAMLVLDWSNAELAQFGPETRIANIAFVAASLRSGGFSTFSIQKLSEPTAFCILVCMYISTSPITVAIKSTNARAAHQRSELLTEVRAHLTKHTLILATLLWVILCLEWKSMESFSTAQCATAAACDLQGFSFFKICFETVSAYGTVGLSLGAATGDLSFSADWTAGSQLLLCSVMLLGRMRGLPEQIDGAFASEWEKPLLKLASSYSLGDLLGESHGRIEQL
ncbi:unnamed protein product [Polarella glacialis]|uniref:Uncharacterized protein n=1 Tax=Polarella glacialis TaxID=89957 RepID=A0A813J385_POLGL|nr:unnamed protein product [Polarella glacialis]